MPLLLQADLDGFPDVLKNLATTEIGQLENIDATTISNTQWGYVGALNQGLNTTSSPTFVNLTTSSAVLTGFIESNDPTSQLYVSGGSNSALGARSLLFGESHATNSKEAWHYADKHTFRNHDSTGTFMDSSVNLYGNLTTTGTIDGVDVAQLKTDHDTLQAEMDAHEDNLQSLTSAEIAQLENINSVTVSSSQWGYVGAMDQGVASSSAVVFAGVETENAGGALKVVGINNNSFRGG